MDEEGSDVHFLVPSVWTSIVGVPDVSLEVVRAFVRTGVSIMPPFRKTEIGDADLNAVAAYLSRKR